MSAIVIDQVSKIFPGGVRAVDDVSLEIESGEFMVLVGPSGCGKSTLLRMIGGLEEVSSGSIAIGERDVTQLGARHRDIAMVFQNYALYPHMSVRKNLAYGLRVRKTPKSEIERRVGEVAAMLGLDELLERRPGALSGGQRQRVAMGRAIVREPAAYLMDEPLSNLDAKLRVDMRTELARLHTRLGTTTVYVTHDQVEAMTLGHRVTVMKDGVIQQVGTPQSLYANPVNLFVAGFIGSPAMNIVEATVTDDSVSFSGFRVPLASGRRPAQDGPVVLGLRPTAFEDVGFSDPSLPKIDARVAVLEELGSESLIVFPVTTADRSVASGRSQLVSDDDLLFTARVSPRTRARVGDRVQLTVDPGEFHFFDRETGLSLL